jgi:phosphohistidine phosphatase
MFVWIVRHAVAADRDEFSGPDEERPLTEKGRKRFRTFCRTLTEQVEAPNLIVTSPLVRAVETAEILAREFGVKLRQVERSDLLCPGAPADELLTFLASHNARTVAAVGHEPGVSRLLARCMGGGEAAFGKGFVAAVEFEGPPAPAAGRLRWLTGPRLTAK